MNKFEIFIEDGLDEDNPYANECSGECDVCGSNLLSKDRAFIVKASTEIVIVSGKHQSDPTISPYGGTTCSYRCAEMYILQHI